MAVQSALAPAASFTLDYGRDIEDEVSQLVAAFETRQLDIRPYPPRWLALKLLELDQPALERVQRMPGGEAIVQLARERAARLRTIFDEDVDILTADRRYGFINGLSRQVLRRPALDRMTLTDRIDDLVTHKWLGLPVFLAVMYVIFRLVIDVSAPFLDWVDSVINGPIAGWISNLLTALAAPDWLRSLIIDGLVAGVGGMLVFVPGLTMLYLFLALLEDTGYMARAAFVMDRLMRVIGLHGKSFIPMILGFGCAVPAIYATRTLAGRRDRILTGLLVPLMSCSARLPVYVVFGLAFFGHTASSVIWLMYALGIVVAMLAGVVFTRTILKPDATSAFVLELPPYRRPAMKGLLIHTWEHTGGFVRKAGTVILSAALILWLLLNLPWGVADQRDSVFGKVSSAIAPAFAPLGFGDWQSAGSLVTGFVAKEVVVSTMGQILVGGAEETGELAPPTTLAEDLAGIVTGFGAAILDAGRQLISLIPGVNVIDPEAQEEGTVLAAALRTQFTPLTALTFIVFVLLYVPCVATLSAIKHEFGGRWAIFSAAYQTAVAWLAAFIVHQGGRLLGFG